MASGERAEPADATDLSLVRDDLPFRWMSRLGLVPEGGLGLFRRALFLALFTWLPIAVWAAWKGRAWSAVGGEPLLQHFDVHVRCLLAIPVLVLAQGFAHGLLTRLLPWFRRSGVVPDSQEEAFRAVLARVRRLRDASLPWAFIGGATLAVAVAGAPATSAHDLVWSVEGEAPSPRLGFGGWWFVYVARPVFLGLLIAWIWRFVLLFVLLRGVAGLALSLVPTHPDRVGGLGFLDRLALVGAPVAFAVSAVFCSHAAHAVVYHEGSLQSLGPPAAALLVVLLVVFLGPFLVFAPRLAAMKRQAELDYGALIGEHGRRVHRRWILREPVSEQERVLLDAPELGPLADTAAAHEAMLRQRAVPLGRLALAGIVVPAALPLLPVVATRIPLREILLKLVGVLL